MPTYDVNIVNELDKLTQMLSSKCGSIRAFTIDYDPILLPKIYMDTASIYAVRMSIDALSGSNGVYVKQIQRFLNKFDIFYNNLANGLCFIDDDGLDLSAELDELDLELSNLYVVFKKYRKFKF